MDCPVCRTPRMMEVSVNLRGRQVSMFACSACETRWWESEGDKIPVENVYELAGKTRGAEISL
jgi:hypothetical protein